MLFRKFALLVPAILILSGCYLPASFDAEMELSRTGLYKMSFDGYIVDLNIYKSMRSKKLKVDSPEFKEKIQKIIDDFERDTSTKSVSYFKQGAFKVNWSKGGDIIKARQVMFFRRNENMLSITYDKKKATIMLKGKYIKSQDAARLEQLGLTVQGVIRIKTDAKVVTHNAQKIWNEGSVKFYGWRLNSIRDKPPLLIVSLGG
ncbi:MAG: hypothetical protein HOF23_01755 [Rhodospirillaceae bacterium]|nr:hypothetical protein [Rhodospirillaceae bacterium]